MTMPKNKHSWSEPCQKPYKFDLEIKGSIMCQIWYGNFKANRIKLQVGHEDMTKADKYDLEVKGQLRIGKMNICVTSSNGDRPMCQIW